MSAPLLVITCLCAAAAGDLEAGSAAGANDSSKLVDASRQILFGLEWRRPVVETGLFRAVGTSFGRPAVSSRFGLVVVGTGEGVVQAYRTRDGELVWTLRHGEPFETSVSLVELEGAPAAGRARGSAPKNAVKGRELALLGSRDNTLLAVDVATGALVWKTDIGGEMRAPASVAGATVVVATSANRVLALEAANGAVLWSAGRPAPTALTVVGHARPLVAGDSVYAAFSDGYAAAFALDDGSQRWARPLSLRGGEFLDADADPVLSGGKLFVASYSDGVYALDPANGQTLWTRPLRAVVSLAAHGDRIVAGSGDGFVWGLARDSGEPVFRTRLAAGLVTRMEIQGDLALFAGGESGLVVLDARSGKPLQASSFGARMVSDPVWVGGSVALLAAEGYLYTFARDAAGRVR